MLDGSVAAEERLEGALYALRRHLGTGTEGTARMETVGDFHRQALGSRLAELPVYDVSDEAGYEPEPLPDDLRVLTLEGPDREDALGQGCEVDQRAPPSVDQGGDEVSRADLLERVAHD